PHTTSQLSIIHNPHNTTSVLLFFFSPPGAHRVLHSFPTRRSSDLAHARRRGRRFATGMAAADDDDVKAPIHAAPLAVPRGTVTLDRKSTRLNSSHDQISYAVFCLKKKIQKNIYTNR